MTHVQQVTVKGATFYLKRDGKGRLFVHRAPVNGGSAGSLVRPGSRKFREVLDAERGVQ